MTAAALFALLGASPAPGGAEPGPRDARAVSRHHAQAKKAVGRHHRDDGYDRSRAHRHSRHAFEDGFGRGRDHGFDQGRRDAQRHRGFDPWRHSRFRKAGSGYRSRFGSHSDYGDGYRKGYLDGYERAFEKHHRRVGRGDRCDDRRRSHRCW
jgi:hypothetical protein